jgi:hypothetical protein
MFASFWPGIMRAQSGSEFDVKVLASNMEQRFKACPRREVVAAFDQKHHKQVWQKQGWGPPFDVFADVKANNESILYPYILTVEFSLSHTFGPERQSEADARGDSQLSQLGSPLSALLTGRYRNIYLASKDGIRVKTRQSLERKLDGTAIEWKDRPSWPDARWDQIGVR